MKSQTVNYPRKRGNSRAEQTIRESFPSVGGVLVESGVSEELVTEALHFLKRGKCSGGPRSPKV
jgi:hypothetical protein